MNRQLYELDFELFSPVSARRNVFTSCSDENQINLTLKYSIFVIYGSDTAIIVSLDNKQGLSIKEIMLWELEKHLECIIKPFI